VPSCFSRRPRHDDPAFRDVVSTKPASAKLGVKAGHKVGVLGAPKGFIDGLKPRPVKVTFTALEPPSPQAI